MKTLPEIVEGQLGHLMMLLLQKEAEIEQLKHDNEHLKEELDGKHST